MAASPHSLGRALATLMFALGTTACPAPTLESEDLWFGESFAWPMTHMQSCKGWLSSSVSLISLLSGESFPVCVSCPLQSKAV